MGAKEKAWDDIARVHEDMKFLFKYTPDIELYGKPEFWAVMNSDNMGDCEDFSLTCRQLLIDKGWERSMLRPACCWTETGGYHAVLVADIEGAAYVLDNRQKSVLPWEDLPYKWDKILSFIGNEWVKITA
jgi:predicted transglutaminase-like cysteine proteinase